LGFKKRCLSISLIVPVPFSPWQLCITLKREIQFADALVSGLKGLGNSERFKIALAGEIKKLIGKNEVTAAAWLCTLLDNDELRRQIPRLPSMLDHQIKVAAKLKKIGARAVFVNGKSV
jgi:hypothetical protein